MTISSRVHSSLFTSTELIRLPPTVLQHYEERQMIHGKHQVPVRRVNLWSREEHDRFLQGLELYPQGPWKLIAAMVGTKTTRQTMTHAQKYRQKINRRQKMQCILNNARSKRDNHVDAYVMTSLEPLPRDDLELVPLPVPCPPAAPALQVATPKQVYDDFTIMHNVHSPQEVTQVVECPFFDAELDELLSDLEPLPLVW
ncbi:hypothetical protein Poli38472_008103 [Pythium oligandrum]|uniref:HTH myb-type domain-containing protein n=1 Tax=Pythium oligandrum TaxID=41045 RepID=A0A8K1FJZ3_PYTOL|nr:hypothetical protein Poli38472_008103 [Pythium oligandrum]|eukprot:TMW65461.1 hypothetical protein Poli38472_008103 [Pythium oligandrum]